jgi:hypothetical protein
MKVMARIFGVIGIVSMFLPATASADDDWQFQITPYLWFAGIKGDVSTIPGYPPAPIDVSSSQALQDTKTSYMGILSVKKGRHAGFVDFLYSDVQSDLYYAPTLNLTLQSTSKTTLVTAGYAYEVYESDKAFVDLFAAARYWEVDSQLDLVGGLGILPPQYAPPYTISNKESWVDPLIGIMARSALGDSKFFVSGILGVGGFGVGSDHLYDASLHFGYQWSKLIGTTLGYRMYDVKYQDGSFLYDVRQQGWLLGLSFTF